MEDGPVIDAHDLLIAGSPELVGLGELLSVASREIIDSHGLVFHDNLLLGSA